MAAFLVKKNSGAGAFRPRRGLSKSAASGVLQAGEAADTHRNQTRSATEQQEGLLSDLGNLIICVCNRLLLEGKRYNV